MKHSKRLSSFAAAAIATLFSVNTPCRSGTLTTTGTFQGVAKVEVQTIVNDQIVSDITYINVASTINFTLAYDSANPVNNYFQFSIDNSVYLLHTNMVLLLLNELYSTLIIDGIPGQSADYAFGAIQISAYPLPSLDAGFQLVDVSGQFIGPNVTVIPATSK